jgi:hypothetical protein
MKKLFIPLLFLTTSAQAQVIECPKFYPLMDTALAEVPNQHMGRGMVSQQPLSGAGLTLGEFNGGGDLHGSRRNLKGGYEIDFGLTPTGVKWFVCSYGINGSTSWWEELKPEEAHCKLKVVNKNSQGVMDASLSCRKAIQAG